MEAVAKIFEQEKGIRDEVENQVKQIHQIQEDDYVPFSEVCIKLLLIKSNFP